MNEVQFAEMIDNNCKSIISKINRNILNNSFDEIDICTLLIMIRDLSHQNHDYQKDEWETGYLHEICDFVAHRKRNRGFVVEEANYIYEKCTQTETFCNDIKVKRPCILGLCEDAIISEINSIFNSLGLADIPSDREDDIILCIITLLQNVEFISSQGVNGYLYASIAADSIILFLHTCDTNFEFNVLCVPNNGYKHTDFEIQLEKECFKLERRGDALVAVLPNEL